MINKKVTVDFEIDNDDPFSKKSPIKHIVIDKVYQDIVIKSWNLTGPQIFFMIVDSGYRSLRLN